MKRGRKGFNRLASSYDFFVHLVLGKSHAKSQAAFPEHVIPSENILIAGGGTGDILLGCLEKNDTASYCYVDISDAMIAMARKKVADQYPEAIERVRFVCGEVGQVNGNREFDVVITSYFLDCFSEKELPEVMQYLDKCLKNDGKWLFADFQIPEKKMNAFFANVLIQLLYWFFNICCGIKAHSLPPMAANFERLGYRVEDEKRFFYDMLVSRVYFKTAQK